MNPKDKIILDSLGIYIDEAIISKYSRQVTHPSEWSRFYYYRNKKRTDVKKSQILTDLQVSSTNLLHRGTFYKMTHLSNDDLFFDYYYKLKDTIGTCVVKKTRRLNKKLAVMKPLPHERNESGSFVIRWT